MVIDEMHLIGDEQRGYLLELLLTKIKFTNQKSASPTQVVAMSATFPNLSQIARWIDAELYVTDFRPIQIREYIKTLDSQLFFQLERTPDGESNLKQVHLPTKTRVPGDRYGVWDMVATLPG